MSDFQVKAASVITRKFGFRVQFQGRLSETELGLAQRARAADLKDEMLSQNYSKNYTEAIIESETGVPWWRNTGGSRPHNELDHYMDGGLELPENAKPHLALVFKKPNLSLEDYEMEFDNWNHYGAYKNLPPGGIIFDNGNFIGRNYLEKWQRYWNW